MKRFVASALLAAIVLGAACGGDDDSGAAAPSGGAGAGLSVVANFYPLYEAAREIGGDGVEVKNLTPAGSEPHDLELTPRQVDQLLDADLVLYLGKGFQPAVEKTVKKRDAASLDILEGLDLDRLPAGHEGETEAAHAEHDEQAAAAAGHSAALEGGLDPHVWLDPALMVQVAERIEAAMAEAAPDQARDFARNARAYRGEIEELDQQFATGLKECERRVLVTAHAAFGYLARRYGLEQRGIAGLSPEAELDPERLAQLTDEVKETGTTTVFSETLASPRIAETLAKEAGVETEVLNPLEGLTKEEAAAGETYVSVMEKNLAALQRGLGCAS